MDINGIWIITRDIRIYDNYVLLAAAKYFTTIYPVFILNKKQIDEGGSNSLHFMFESLESLNNKLINYGSCIFFIYDDEFLDGTFCKYHNIKGGVIQKAYTPFEKERYIKYSDVLSLLEVEDCLGWEVNSILKADKTPYVVHSAFRENAMKKGVPYPIDFVNFNFAKEKSKNSPISWKSALPPKPRHAVWVGGDFEGERLAMIISQRGGYLSPHLKFGTVSPRVVFHYAYSRNIEGIVDGLTWRAQYTSLTYMNAALRRNPSIPWDNRLFHYWESGTTGYDIVDAGINELVATGFMHNLTRMVTANFLLFGLKCDWHLGEAFFRKHLVDYDLILNQNNWYWCCGLGIDHPRPNNAFGGKQLRIFNPVTYATNGTPENKKVKKALIERWCPVKHNRCISIEEVTYNQQVMASYF